MVKRPLFLRLLAATANGFMVLGLAATLVSVHAKEAAPVADNPELEQRMLLIAQELRCLVCQNQTIADSHSDLAQDLRAQIRQLLSEGKSADEVRNYMTERYGNFVLYRPPMMRSTALLWFGPLVLLLGGMAALLMALRRRVRMQADAFDPDDPAET
jgi:cytochrome c-type biogenesis protein CcmH